LILLALVLSFTCLLPALNIFILYRFKIIRSVFLEDSNERAFPFLITSIFYFGMAFLIWDFNISIIFRSLAVAGGICIVITAFINRFWKISAHLVGIGGQIGALLFISFLLKHNFLYYVSFFMLVAGILGYARIKIGAHNPAQVYYGFLLGAIGTALTLYALFVSQIIIGRSL
jgi:hypothetical protein